MLTSIGSVMLAVGLFCCWLDISSNGAKEAEWAGLTLSMAIVGAVLIGAEYYRS